MVSSIINHTHPVQPTYPTWQLKCKSPFTRTHKLEGDCQIEQRAQLQPLRASLFLTCPGAGRSAIDNGKMGDTGSVSNTRLYLGNLPRSGMWTSRIRLIYAHKL